MVRKAVSKLQQLHELEEELQLPGAGIQASGVASQLGSAGTALEQPGQPHGRYAQQAKPCQAPPHQELRRSLEPVKSAIKEAHSGEGSQGGSDCSSGRPGRAASQRSDGRSGGSRGADSHGSGANAVQRGDRAVQGQEGRLQRLQEQLAANMEQVRLAWLGWVCVMVLDAFMSANSLPLACCACSCISAFRASLLVGHAHSLPSLLIHSYMTLTCSHMPSSTQIQRRLDEQQGHSSRSPHSPVNGTWPAGPGQDTCERGSSGESGMPAAWDEQDVLPAPGQRQYVQAVQAAQQEVSAPSSPASSCSGDAESVGGLQNAEEPSSGGSGVVLAVSNPLFGSSRRGTAEGLQSMQDALLPPKRSLRRQGSAQDESVSPRLDRQPRRQNLQASLGSLGSGFGGEPSSCHDEQYASAVTCLCTNLMAVCAVHDCSVRST